MNAYATLPPQNLEAEEWVLGAMIFDEKARSHALDELQPEDFSRKAHRLVFEAVAAMSAAGTDIDEATLCLWMRDKGTLVEAGGGARVVSYVERTPAMASHRAYVREVKNQALLLGLVRTGNLMVEIGNSADLTATSDKNASHPVRIALEDATAALITFRERVEQRTYAKRSDIGSLIEDWVGRYLTEQSDPALSLAVPFPAHMPRLNDWTMGQRPGRLIVSSGFTGHGKSWFGLDCTESFIRHGERTAYFSLELPRDEILERLVGMGGVSYAGIQNRDTGFEVMEDRLMWLGQNPDLLTVLDGTTNMQRIESEVIAARVAGKPYRHIVVDTLNLIEFPGRAADRRFEIDRGLMKLKNIAIDHNLTAHVQAQLNRDKSRNPADPPTLTDLKESGGIEQTADLVLFLHRMPGVQPETLADHGLVVVAKGRNLRRRGRINVSFDSNGLRFRETPGNGSYVAGMKATA